MTNDITGLPGSIVQNTPDKTAVNSQNQGTRTSDSGNQSSARTDSVSVSSAAAHLQSLESQIADLPVVDSQRVEAIRHDIATNNYEIDAMKIAGRAAMITGGAVAP